MHTMRQHSVRRYFVAMLSLIAVVFGLMAQVQPAKAISVTWQSSPITLRLAVSDAQDTPSTPIVLAFIEEVKQRSEGSLFIEPVWDAGADTEAEFEQGVIAAVRAGEYELGLAATRAWEEQGVIVFQPLQTPFLIDNDALAVAVATSEISTQMLEGLSASGLAGLAMWPEDLRHPFSVVPGQPLLSLDDFAGKTIRTSSMDVAADLMEALGGTPIYLADEYQGAESGLRQGFSLTGLPIATGNVVFFTKFQVLFANGAAFEELDTAQRTILREAAAAAQQKAITERPSEAEAAEIWCADGGSIVLASEEQIAALQAAAQPVIDQIAQNPDHTEVIAALQELKAATSPSPWADACGSQTSPAASDNAEQAWSEGLPPNGIWMVELSADDFVQRGMLRSVAERDWAGTYTFTLADGEFSFTWISNWGFVAGCRASYQAVGDIVRFTYHRDTLCEGEVTDAQWRLNAEGGLVFHVVELITTEKEIRGIWEAQPWQKISD